MRTPVPLFAGLVAIALTAAGCAVTQHPLLYPNPHLEGVGQARAEQDVSECLAMAEQYGGGGTNTTAAAQRGVTAAAIGAAAGAAEGAARGGRVGARAGGLAARRGTTGFLGGLFGGTYPDPATKGFVNECLRQKGYRVVGWH